MSKNTTDDGGTAFPYREQDSNGQYRDHYGMTLRDYFAAAALSGSVGYVNEFEPAYEASLKHTATAAYRIADAMLAARKEQS